MAQNDFIRKLAAGFLAGGIVICAWGIWTIVKAKKSADWPSVKGTLISSSIRSNIKTASSDSYEAKILYSYTVNGKTYTGKRVCYGDFGIRTRSRAEKIIAHYPEGKNVRVFYDPDDPKEGILEPGITRESFGFFGIGVICILGSLHIMLSSPRKRKIKK